MKFRERFRLLLKRSGLSQRELSERIQRETGVRIPQGTISDYVASGVEPSLANAVAIARTLGVSVEYLAGETDRTDTVTAMQTRLQQLRMPQAIEKAALLASRMPPAEQAEIVSYITVRFRQWKQLNGLIQLARKMDVNGSLAARIQDLSGVDISANDTPVNLIDDDLLSDGDTHGVNDQLALFG